MNDRPLVGARSSVVFDADGHIPNNSARGWRVAISADELADWRDLFGARRRRWLLTLLGLALDESPGAGWDLLVELACQYGGRAVPRPEAVEFEEIRHLSVSAVLGVREAADDGCVCRLGPDCPRPGRCDDSAIAAQEEVVARAEFGYLGKLGGF